MSESTSASNSNLNPNPLKEHWVYSWLMKDLRFELLLRNQLKIYLKESAVSDKLICFIFLWLLLGVSLGLVFLLSHFSIPILSFFGIEFISDGVFLSFCYILLGGIFLKVYKKRLKAEQINYEFLVEHSNKRIKQKIAIEGLWRIGRCKSNDFMDTKHQLNSRNSDEFGDYAGLGISVMMRHSCTELLNLKSMFQDIVWNRLNYDSVPIHVKVIDEKNPDLKSDKKKGKDEFDPANYSEYFFCRKELIHAVENIDFIISEINKVLQCEISEEILEKAYLKFKAPKESTGAKVISRLIQVFFAYKKIAVFIDTYEKRSDVEELEEKSGSSYYP